MIKKILCIVCIFLVFFLIGLSLLSVRSSAFSGAGSVYDPVGQPVNGLVNCSYFPLVNGFNDPYEDYRQVICPGDGASGGAFLNQYSSSANGFTYGFYMDYFHVSTTYTQGYNTYTLTPSSSYPLNSGYLCLNNFIAGDVDYLKFTGIWTDENSNISTYNDLYVTFDFTIYYYYLNEDTSAQNDNIRISSVTIPLNHIATDVGTDSVFGSGGYYNTDTLERYDMEEELDFESLALSYLLSDNIPQNVTPVYLGSSISNALLEFSPNYVNYDILSSASLEYTYNPSVMDFDVSDRVNGDYIVVQEIVTVEDGSLFNWIMDAIQGVLDINIFGGLTFGHLILTLIAIPIVLAILKLIAGG